MQRHPPPAALCKRALLAHETVGTIHSVIPSSTTSPPSTGLLSSLSFPFGKEQEEKSPGSRRRHKGDPNTVSERRCKRMWLLCGCYSGHPCPLLDTGLVRPDRGNSSGHSKRPSLFGSRSGHFHVRCCRTERERGGSESSLRLIGLEKLRHSHVTDSNHLFFPRLFLFPSKGSFCLGFQFLFLLFVRL